MHPLYFLYDAWALLALRVVLGDIFLHHGWPKLKNWSATAEAFQNMGFRPGKLFVTCAILLEVFGGTALIFGFLTPVVSAFAIVQFAVIVIWKMRKGQPLKDGYELDLLILAAMIVLFTLGAGQYSLDKIFFGWV